MLQLAVIHRRSFQDGKSLSSNQASILWVLRSFLVHPRLQQNLDQLVYAFDVAALFTDGTNSPTNFLHTPQDADQTTDLNDTVRAQLSKLSSTKPPHTPMTNFLFYTAPSPDAWLGLVSPHLASNQSGTPNPLPQTPNTPTRVNAVGTPNRPITPQSTAGTPTGAPPQPQQQQQQQQPPPQRMMPGQQQQQQQAQLTLQQMQAKHDLRPVPFVMRRWEILPDPASGATGSGTVNDTALSLSLFEARKVT